jgi:hypothetical protein
VKRLIKNNAFQYLSLSALIILTVYGLSATKGMIVAKSVYLTFFEVLDIIIAVSIFIGLFQIWVKPATIVKWLGKGSGVKGFAFVCTFPIFMGGSLFTIFCTGSTLFHYPFCFRHGHIDGLGRREVGLMGKGRKGHN